MKYSEEAELLSRMYQDLPEILSQEDLKKLRNIHGEFIAGYKFLVNEGPFVTVFGSSRTRTDHPDYQIGYKLGALLARHRISVLTGGGPGVMEAVNKGAKEGGGKSMGINISIPEEQIPNPYANPSITLDHFFVRKVLLLKYSTAYLFLPGGFGTLDEFFETVTLIQTKKIKPFPVIIMNGEFWKGLFDWIKEKLQKGGMINGSDLGYFTFVETPEEAIEAILRAPVQ